MNTPFTRKLLTALICGGILIAAAPAAHADRDDRGKHYKKHHYKHHRHWDERTVYREQVIIRERPRYYRAPRYRQPEIHNHYYAQPYPSYGYSSNRSPALVIGVDIPSIVIPLR